ncbi:hypothetical protein M569_17583, partial [Genlisea aurea]
QEDYYTKIFYELSALVFNVMRPPHPSRSSDGPSFERITPAGFACLLLGVSVALMLCGSVTFFLGFMLMPWVVGSVVFVYFVGVISSISVIGKAIMCCCNNNNS